MPSELKTVINWVEKYFFNIPEIRHQCFNKLGENSRQMRECLEAAVKRKKIQTLKQ